MTKKYSESAVGEALRGMDLESIVFKPQDFPGPSQNRKPADFLVWWRDPANDVHNAWPAMVEVKECPNQSVFPLGALTPSQVLAMRDAVRIRLPYWLVVYWKPAKASGAPRPGLPRWTITTGERVVVALDAGGHPLARTAFLADCATHELGSTLRLCLAGEFD